MFFFFQAEDGIRDYKVTGVQTCALPILASGEHKELNNLIGEWTGTMKTWFEPGDPVDTAAITGTIRPLFDGRFVMLEYKRSEERRVGKECRSRWAAD